MNYCNLHGPFESNALVAVCPTCTQHRALVNKQEAALAEQSAHQDNLQRREYAKAALAIVYRASAYGERHLDEQIAAQAFHMADAMLKRQKEIEHG